MHLIPVSLANPTARNGEECLHVLKVIFSAYQAAELGRTVTLTYQARVEMIGLASHEPLSCHLDQIPGRASRRKPDVDGSQTRWASELPLA